MHYSNKKNKVSLLVKSTKYLELTNISDLRQANRILESVFEEWSRMRTKFRKKLQNKKINEYLYAEYEAEEEIVIGLISLLNEKIINFILLHK